MGVVGNVWWLRDEKMRESGRKERKPHKTKTHITSHHTQKRGVVVVEC